VGLAGIEPSGPVPDGTPSVKLDAKLDAFVRPHDVQVRRQAPPGGRSIPATIVRTTRLGWQFKIELKLPSGRLLSIQHGKEQAEALGLAAGDNVFLTLSGAKIFAQRFAVPRKIDWEPREEVAAPT
jgi:ABC-type sulfate/molybdate transport systems ATPase subunit